MPLTTAGPPPAGVYAWAVIYTQAELNATARYSATYVPECSANLHATARYAFQAPRAAVLSVSAKYMAVAGTVDLAAAKLRARASYRAGFVPTSAARMSVHARYATVGAAVEPLTPPPSQLNVAVTRAATI